MNREVDAPRTKATARPSQGPRVLKATWMRTAKGSSMILTCGGRPCRPGGWCLWGYGYGEAGGTETAGRVTVTVPTVIPFPSLNSSTLMRGMPRAFLSELETRMAWDLKRPQGRRCAPVFKTGASVGGLRRWTAKRGTSGSLSS